MDEQRPWHRLFSMSWTDFFRGMPVTVDSERDLSLKKQLLDVTLIHKEAGPLNCRLPDGFEDLATYNLVTFKSHQEKLSGFTLEELLGHYVNLRKQVSPSMGEADLLSPDEFKLFAVTVRFPRNLANDNVVLEPIKQGVYEIAALTRRIRLVVVSQLPQEEQNAMLHLFSTSVQKFVYGSKHYRIRSIETSSILLQLYERFGLEVANMPDMLEELARETIEKLLKEMPVEKRLEGLSTEERLAGLSDEMLAALPRQSREALIKRLKATQ